jgi:hypothetical protein
MYHGAEHERGASAFLVRAMAHERSRARDLGHLQVAFPASSFGEHPEDFGEVVLEMCRKLHPISGYGGIGLIESADSAISTRFEPLVCKMAQRFPGLEADYPSCHAPHLSQGIKGVNWLTILGARWVAKLGGARALERELSELDRQLIVYRTRRCIMIQAGPKPQLGDLQQNIWPELYIQLAKALSRIQVPVHGPFHRAGSLDRVGMPRFNQQRSEAWLRRFTDRQAAPAAGSGSPRPAARPRAPQR